MRCSLTIRQYLNNDCETVSRLFYETIHAVCANDYTAEQLFAWAKDTSRLQMRKEDLLNQYTLVAETDGKIVGFGSIDNSGCLDLLFVHKDFQNQGVATALCDRLEQGFSEVVTYASVTAKAFFEKRGYIVAQEREVERLGVKLKNYEMQKYIK